MSGNEADPVVVEDDEVAAASGGKAAEILPAVPKRLHTKEETTSPTVEFSTRQLRAKKPKVECPCCAVHEHSDHLNDPKEIHLEPDSFQCAKCAAEYPRANERNAHERSAHGYLRRTKKWRYWARLGHHVAESDAGDGQQNEEWTCPYCSLKCPAQGRDVHLHTHSFIGGFKCHLCAARFRYSRARDKHERRKHHYERPAPVKIEPQEVAEAKKPSRFVRAVHEKQSCRYCGIKYLLIHMKRHQRVHLHGNGHKCHVCASVHSSRWNRGLHERKVHAYDRRVEPSSDEQTGHPPVEQPASPCTSEHPPPSPKIARPTGIQEGTHSPPTCPMLEVLQLLRKKPTVVYFDIDYCREKFGKLPVNLWLKQPAGTILVVRSNSPAFEEVAGLPPPVCSARMSRVELSRSENREAFAHVFAKKDAAELAARLCHEMGAGLLFAEFAAEVLSELAVPTALLITSAADRESVDVSALAAQGTYVF